MAASVARTKLIAEPSTIAMLATLDIPSRAQGVHKMGHQHPEEDRATQDIAGDAEEDVGGGVEDLGVGVEDHGGAETLLQERPWQFGGGGGRTLGASAVARAKVLGCGQR